MGRERREGDEKRGRRRVVGRGRLLALSSALCLREEHKWFLACTKERCWWASGRAETMARAWRDVDMSWQFKSHLRPFWCPRGQRISISSHTCSRGAPEQDTKPLINPSGGLWRLNAVSVNYGIKYLWSKFYCVKNAKIHSAIEQMRYSALKQLNVSAHWVSLIKSHTVVQFQKYVVVNDERALKISFLLIYSMCIGKVIGYCNHSQYPHWLWTDSFIMQFQCKR